MLRKSYANRESLKAPLTRRRSTGRRSFGLGLIAIIATLSIVGALARPAPAHAQLGGVVSDIGATVQRVVRNVVDAARWIADQSDKFVDKIAKKVGDVAFKNALKVFLGKIAEDTATWVASGAPGQGPAFITDPKYFKNLGDAAAGDYLDSLALDQFGYSLCDPGTFKLQIDVALRVNLNPNFCQEACKQNYDSQLNQTLKICSFVAGSLDCSKYINFTTTKTAQDNLSALLQEQQKGIKDTPIAGCRVLNNTTYECIQAYQMSIANAQASAEANLKVCNKVCSSKKRTASCTLTTITDNIANSSVILNGTNYSAVDASKLSFGARGLGLQEAFNKGDLPKIFNPDQNPLGQYLVLTASADQAAAEAKQNEQDILNFGSVFPLRSLISGSIKTPQKLTEAQVQAKLNPEDPTTVQTGSPVADAFGIFTNTLTSKLIDRILKKGIVDDKGNPTQNFGFTSGNIGSSVGGVQAAKNRFASLSQVSFGTGGGMDILNDLSGCPTDVASVTETSIGIVSSNNCVLDPSLRQAIEERLTVKEALDRGLLSDQKVFGFNANGQEPDFRNGYPYRSLIILRKYRIIPVGWELAAQYIRDFEKQNVSISTIVGQFDDAASPYYRLIDPSWVLKAPENICLRTGFTGDVVSTDYTDTDGDEGGKKNIDYTKRYCNTASDANVGKPCECDDPNAPADVACKSGFDNGTSDPIKSPNNTKCVEKEVGNLITPKATCAFITPREQQVQRQQACVDERTCILENDDGTCKQYGSCVEEKDAWRFNGQSCSGLYASCQSYTNSAGTAVSYLQNTLQKSVCGPENAGCQQYCTAFDYGASKWACTSATPGTKRFDKDLQGCDETGNGCTQFIRQTKGTNLLPNGNFEQSTPVGNVGNTKFTGWQAGNDSQTCGAQTFVSTNTVGGTQAARVQWAADCTGGTCSISGGACTVNTDCTGGLGDTCTGDTGHKLTNSFDTGTPLAGRTLTVSFYAKSEGAACTMPISFMVGSWSAPVTNPDITPDWQRYSYTVDVPTGTTGNRFTTFFRPTQSCTYDLDNVQAEEGSTLTDYKDYGAVNVIHLKRSPTGYCSNDFGKTCEADSECGGLPNTCVKLQCTGNVATDPAACSKFITKCTADDVGCDLFTPIAGGMSIPAKPGLTCPADKVGCASFREQPTSGVLEVVPERTGYYCKSDLPTKFTSCDPANPVCPGGAADCQPLVSFVSKTGQQCTAQEVGCEAFTNQDDVAKGGEGKTQFTKLQQCVPLDYDPTLLANYYTWVGSEETGYQLKKYSLVQSNVNAQAPCTNLGHDLPLNCQDNVQPVVDCQVDFNKNPDCTQYYDEGGNITYRLRSRVIEPSADCHPYRNAVDNLIYYADGVRSLTCSIAAVGCRSYLGNTGSNTRTVVYSDFESGSYAPWYAVDGSISTESVNYGGHSFRIGDVGNGGTRTTWVETDNLIKIGGTYVVKFWAKSLNSGANNVAVVINGPGGYVATVGSTVVGNDWNEYNLGPVTYDAPGGLTPSSLEFSSTSDLTYYLDNISFVEVGDDDFGGGIYKIKGSQTACGGFEGCQAYTNRAGQTVNYQGFTRLCQSEKVGCEALLNTQNSSNPFSQTTTLPNLRGDVDGSGKINQADIDYLAKYLNFGGPPPYPLDTADVNGNGAVDAADLSALTAYVTGTNPNAISMAAYNGDTIITPADKVEYWVNDDSKACSSALKGCRALGRQTITIKQSGASYAPSLQGTETVYGLDNPDDYNKILCGKEALSCDEFTTPEGGTSYFRNPDKRACSYREENAGLSAGWYLDGTNTSCPTRNLNNIPPAVPTGGFAGLCPAEQSGCGMFLDPLGTGESLTTNADFELPSTVPPNLPQGWYNTWCSNDVNRTCTANADCGTGICNTSMALRRREDRTGGSKAVQLTLQDHGNFRQTISLNADTNYVISAEIQQNPNEKNSSIRLGVANCRNAQNSWVSTYSPDQSMLPRTDGASMDVPGDRFQENTFTRISGRFYSGTAVTCQIYAGTLGGGVGHWFDKLQVNVTSSTPVLRQSVDSKSCNGQVGDKLGCHLFNDTSSTTLSYDVDQSPTGGKPTDKDASGGPASCTTQPESCDSNVLLKVTRDRVCSQWLAPTTSIESTKPNGTKENLTVGVATCDSFGPSGQCNHFVDEKRCTNNLKQTCVDDSDCNGGACKPMTVTGNYPSATTAAYSRESLRNKSGLVIAGLEWGKVCSNNAAQACDVNSDCGVGNTCLNSKKITGKYPVGISPQVGEDGIAVPDQVINGNFSSSKTLAASGWDLQQSSKTDGSSVVLKTFDLLGSGVSVAPVNVDPYLTVTPSASGSSSTILRTTTATLANKVSPGRTYMLAFSVRYMQQPGKDAADTAISAGISSGEVSARNAWFGKVTPSTDWQQFVVGPLKLSADAKTTEGNIFGPNHNDYNAGTGFIYFSMDVSNRTAFAIDNVSILPALQVDDTTSPYIIGRPNGDIFTARSCRAYPTSTALSCSYTDDTGKQYNGWQGYCLQVDPKNPNICLSWYPVDVVAGDRNVFGKVDIAGYNGKAPAYMCLKSTGKYDTGKFTNSKDNKIYVKGYRKIYDFNPTIDGGSHSVSFPDVINKNEIDRIALIMTSQSNEAMNACGSGDVRQSQILNSLFNRDGRSAHTGMTPDGCAYMILDVNAEYPNTNRWEATWDLYATPTTHYLTFGVTFNPNTNNLVNYIYSVGDSGFTAKIFVYLKEMCTNIVKAVDDNGGNKAWAASINSDSYTLPNYAYRKSKDDVPYGSIAPSDYSSPDQWPRLPVIEGSSLARAGASYSCPSGQNCNGRLCLGISYDKLKTAASYSCDNVQDIANCYLNGGYCGGVGPAKICVSGPKAPINGTYASCNSDTDCGTGKCDYGYNQYFCSGSANNGKDCTKYAGVYGTSDPSNTADTSKCPAPGVCTLISNKTGGVYATNKALNPTMLRLRLLFAKVYGDWTWSTSTNSYQTSTLETNDVNNYWQSSYDGMSLCGTGGFDRSFASLSTADGSPLDSQIVKGYCGILPEVTNVSIGKTTGGDVIINSGEVLQLTFNTVVDKEQVPLQVIAIDWDGDARADQQVEWGFAPRSDPADPHSVSHAYRYGAGIASNQCYKVNEGPYKDNARVRGHEYCVAHPQVQIRDNWDWCNGGRCLSSTNPFPVDAPAPGYANYWEPFSGNVIIVR